MLAPAPALPLALLAALLAATLGQAGTASVEPTTWTTPPPPHPAIWIQGDAGFTAPGSGVRGGTGTPEDPYRIADWTILRFSAYGIRLSGTRAHTLIENVLLEGNEGLVTHRAECLDDPTAFCLGPQGISLVNAENVTIRNVRIVASSYGVRATDSARIVVSESVFGSSSSRLVSLVNGVELRGVQEAIVSHVHFLRVLTPYRAVDSTDLRFERNEIAPRASSDPYLEIRNTDRVHFGHNFFDHATIYTEGRVANLSVVENTFVDSPGGLVARSSTQSAMISVLVCGNTFDGAWGAEAGVLLRNVHGATISHNRLLDGVVGILVNDGTRVRVDSNYVVGHSSTGLQMTASGNEVHHNHFERNAGGVRIVRPGNATLNWWGAPDGPSGDGPGSGQPLLRFGSGAIFDPWLTSPPNLGFDCAPGEDAGIAGPPPEAVLAAQAGVRAHLQVDASPLPVREERTVEAGYSTLPIGLPW